MSSKKATGKTQLMSNDLITHDGKQVDSIK